MELDEEKFRDHAPNEPQVHSAGLDATSRLPTPARAKPSGKWLLALFVHYRLQTYRRLSLQNYTDFLKRSRCKVHQQTRKRPGTGRYLDMLDWLQPLGDNGLDPTHNLTIWEMLITSVIQATDGFVLMAYSLLCVYPLTHIDKLAAL